MMLHPHTIVVQWPKWPTRHSPGLPGRDDDLIDWSRTDA